MYHDYIRDSRRRVAKNEADEGVESVESFLNNLADDYYEIEHVKQAEEKISEINSMTDAQLIIQVGDYEKIDVETTIDGKKQLSGNAERDIISNSIIEAMQKSGIVSFEEFNLAGDSAKIDQVKKIIYDKLLKQGIISKDVKLEDFIPDLDKKILDQNSKIKKENPNAIQDKLIDDAIIEEVMSNGDISNVDTDKIVKNAEKSLGNVLTSESASVVSSMNNGKTIDSEKTITSEAVEARKAIMASKLSLSAKERESAKERAKKKSLRELEAMIISSSDTETGEETSDSNVDNVLETLQSNTDREKTKKELVEVSQKTKAEKRKKFLTLLYDDDGMIDSRKLAEQMAFVDGSRKAVDNYKSRVDESIGNSDVETMMKKGRKQKNI